MELLGSRSRTKFRRERGDVGLRMPLTMLCKSSHGQVEVGHQGRQFPHKGNQPTSTRTVHVNVVPVLYPDSRYRYQYGTAFEFMRCIHSTPLHKPYLYLPIPGVRPFLLPKTGLFPMPHPASRPPLAAYRTRIIPTVPALVPVPVCKRFSVPATPAPIRHTQSDPILSSYIACWWGEKKITREKRKKKKRLFPLKKQDQTEPLPPCMYIALALILRTVKNQTKPQISGGMHAIWWAVFFQNISTLRAQCTNGVRGWGNHHGSQQSLPVHLQAHTKFPASRLPGFTSGYHCYSAVFYNLFQMRVFAQFLIVCPTAPKVRHFIKLPGGWIKLTFHNYCIILRKSFPCCSLRSSSYFLMSSIPRGNLS